MSQTTKTGTEKYLGKIERANNVRDDLLRDIRLEALYDTDLPDLDRAVLGLTGSDERLTHYREVNEEISRNIGKPIIIVTAMRPKSFQNQDREVVVKEAQGGIIAGEIKVKFGSPLSHGAEDEEPKIDSASMIVPVLPVVAYQHYERSKPATYLNEQTGDYDRREGEGRLKIASISPNYRARPDEHDERPMFDGVVPNLFVGRRSMYTSELFLKGVHNLLEAIEDAR
jgi:hypothetical protein